MVVDLLSLADASALLGVSPERVRQLVVGGQLPGVKFGNAWAVPRDALAARRWQPGRRGRPLSPMRAWVRLLAGGVDLAERSQFLHRAELFRYEMSRADLDTLSARYPVMVSGVAGAIEHGEPLIRSGSGGDLYVPESFHERLPQLVVMFADPLGSVSIRVVPEDAWRMLGEALSDLGHGRPIVAPRSAVALDLLDSGDPRHWIAAEHLVRGER